MIKNYENMFPNRYYFLIALTFIKFYVNEDFTEEYAKIVEKEVKAKEKKIAKKLEEKGRIEKRIKQMQATKGNASELEGEKLNLEK